MRLEHDTLEAYSHIIVQEVVVQRILIRFSYVFIAIGSVAVVIIISNSKA